MNKSISRRQFLHKSTTISAGLATLSGIASIHGADAPNNKIVLGVMGTNGRGAELIHGFTALAGVEIAYVCDVDDRAMEKGVKAVAEKQERQPKGVKDFRRILDDRSVDALVIAAPDHWHGPATILACAAGKHVYVEKPACHNPHEGELMVVAARKHNRVVQLGTQRRSMPGVVEAIRKVHNGELGRVLFSRGWYTNTRGDIGRGKPAPVPAWLDYSLWQGPAPERGYRNNVIHYNWHWFWHWGTGELGNNGIHAIDLCRWGLQVDFPRRITSGGGRYHFDDDQETPDTNVVTWDFGDKVITWEGRSCQRRGFEGSMFGVGFYGDKGSLIIDGSNYKIYDEQDREISSKGGSGSDRPHQRNFLDCIRSGKRPDADIEAGHKSTLLCHLGNIAYRTGHTINFDPKSQRIVGDHAAAAMWRREYRKGWEPKV